MRHILYRRNVVGVSRTLKPKIYESIGEVDEDTMCVRVYVSRKEPESRLAKRDIIPKRVRVGLRRYETDVVEVGEVKALSLTSKVRPLREGYSIGHYAVTAGTLGAFVFSGGNIYVLSNNHVLANSSTDIDVRARIGDAVLQPGRYDGGKYSIGDAGDAVGGLYAYIPLLEGKINYVDAALASLLSTDLFSDTIYSGHLDDDKMIRVGMALAYYGRSSGFKRVTVFDESATIRVNYSGKILTFEDQIVFKPNSIPGDSGSVLFDEKTRLAVGLVFAGSDRIGVANKMWRVVEEFRRIGIDISFRKPPELELKPAVIEDVYVEDSSGNRVDTLEPDKWYSSVAVISANRYVRGYVAFMHVSPKGVPSVSMFPLDISAGSKKSIALRFKAGSDRGVWVLKAMAMDREAMKIYDSKATSYRVS